MVYFNSSIAWGFFVVCRSTLSCSDFTPLANSTGNICDCYQKSLILTGITLIRNMGVFSLSLQKLESENMILYKKQTICKWKNLRILAEIHMAEIKIQTKIKFCYIFANLQIINGKCRNIQWLFN